MSKPSKVMNGTDLILSMGGGALAYSTGCKVTTSAETNERVTKEEGAGKWKDKVVKTLSESISADGLVCTDGSTGAPTYDQLKDAMISGTPVEASYNIRNGNSREGKTTAGYSGKYIITSLDLDGQAGEDAKYSVQLENCGAITKVGNGLQDEDSTTE